MQFWEVVAFQWVNPKAWISIISALSIYAPKDHYLPAVAQIVAASMIINVPVVFLWAGAGVAVSRFLETAGRLRAFNLAMGAALALSVIPMLFEG